MVDDGIIAKKFQARVQYAQNKIIGNESLFGELENDAAEALLALGLEVAEKIALDSKDKTGEEAEISMVDSLSALQKFMRHLGQLLSKSDELQKEERQWLWDSICDNAKLLFGNSLKLLELQDFIMNASKDVPVKDIISRIRNEI